ncbi:transcriptional regulator, CadC [Rubellimicrobium mesophilum DSM 19309]|uniref:Transcriptional regulator, CadC n=1 Tax=Rubellimicrobium mesophilum DSM 19309 TaxID=442562 RepID=A0A017HVD7_9RHOB|nr:winged helix-turn-helix domain-containing protein [Rubellimicrobium mesophilum]EYD78093.1 transcriptional regulator, CadC [Rubellimicrobium mesophilum DSM 19309]
MPTHTFGEFDLDEEARSLTLRGEPVAMQPLVFDLLTYLVRHAGRVVPKDELLDRLWPGLHVTEASLQRAVSLARGALRLGGLDGSLRSIVRVGYRFGLDRASMTDLAARTPVGSEAVALARQAAGDRRWSEADERFAEADREHRLGPEDLDLWAFSLECLARPKGATPIYARAVEGHLALGDHARAAHSAAQLSKVHLELGHPDAGRAWLARAEELLRSDTALAPLAYILWLKSRYAVFAGRPDESLDIIGRAIECAEAAGSASLRALTMAYQGFYHITLGQIAEGRACQDQAAAIALSSEVDPLSGGLVYCSILWTCRTFADWSRAAQWCPGFELWCDMAFAQITGACRLHHADTLGAVGQLPEALIEIDHAIDGLTREGTWEIGDACRVRGDILAMLGDPEGAGEAYQRAIAFGWDAEPGLAQLLAASGDVRGALASIERALGSRSWYGLQRRGWLLANAAQIAAAAGLSAEAQAALDELDRPGDPTPIPAIRAMAVEARADLAAQGGDPVAALHLLHFARQLWTSVRHEYHAARLRLRLGDLLDASGDRSGARMERAAARAAAERIGARELLAKALDQAAEGRCPEEREATVTTLRRASSAA